MEKVTSTACLFGSGLNYILHLDAHAFMRSKSWFISEAAAFALWTTVKRDVSSAKSLALHLRSSVKSLTYTRKNNGPRIEPWGTPAVTVPQFDVLTVQKRTLLSVGKEASNDFK